MMSSVPSAEARSVGVLEIVDVEIVNPDLPADSHTCAGVTPTKSLSVGRNQGTGLVEGPIRVIQARRAYSLM